MQKSKISEDLILNYISMAIMAGGGLLFSIVIGTYYNADILGVFNTVYAYYIVLSQLCACGIHMAMTKYCAQYAEDKRIISELLINAGFLTFMISVCIVGVGNAFFNWFLTPFFKKQLLEAVNMIWPALIFFSLNKVFLNYLNGILKMKAYAFFQGIRNVLIAAVIIVLAYFGVSGYHITVCFFISEFILFVGEFVYLIFNRSLNRKWTFKWVAPLFFFGIRIMPANIVLELNTKVDILCMSWLLKDDEIVGIYSFAALFAEGFYQVVVVLRRMLNPHITRWYEDCELEQNWHGLKKKYGKFIYAGSIIFMMAICGIHYLFGLLLKGSDYGSGTAPLIIICIFIVLNLKAVLLGNVLAQTGNPFEESIVNVVTVVSNIILNIIFIKIWGMTGAALATGLSYAVFSLVQHFFIMKKTRLKL